MIYAVVDVIEDFAVPACFAYDFRNKGGGCCDHKSAWLGDKLGIRGEKPFAFRANHFGKLLETGGL